MANALKIAKVGFERCKRRTLAVSLQTKPCHCDCEQREAGSNPEKNVQIYCCFAIFPFTYRLRRPIFCKHCLQKMLLAMTKS